MIRVDKDVVRWLLFVVLILTTLTGCGGGISNSLTPMSAPLNANNLNLIFVVSEDLPYHAAGDINLKTANLTNQGLQRSLLLSTFIKTNVLGMHNVNRVYAIQPMSHPQTSAKFPDMAALETAQNIGLLNQVTLSGPSGAVYAGNSYPVNASYGSQPVPVGVATPLIACSDCQGLDFADQGSDNEALLTNLLKTNVPGYYIFASPWETTRSLLAYINQLQGSDLAIPTIYGGPNYVYAISIPASGKASLITYNSQLSPPSTYPALPRSSMVGTTCDAKHFTISVAGGTGGAVVPAAINTNETVYMIRHAEAHPVKYFEDGNYVCAGQWRALNLPNALRGKVQPDRVYSIDPAQVTPGAESTSGMSKYSYVRPSLTVEPYAIANELPYDLAASFELCAQNPPQLATAASEFFFNGGQFSNQRLLVAWEHDHIPPTINALLASYHGDNQPAPDWPDDDYDTIWTITLDANGNLTVDNSKCEGMKSASMPSVCPLF